MPPEENRAREKHAQKIWKSLNSFQRYVRGQTEPPTCSSQYYAPLWGRSDKSWKLTNTSKLNILNAARIACGARSM